MSKSSSPPARFPRAAGIRSKGLLVTDTNIYATSSDPTNMTEELNTDRKTIYIFDINGKNKQVFCTGIRNTEKLRYPPGHDRNLGLRSRLGQLRQDLRRNDPARISPSPISIRPKNSIFTSKAVSTAIRIIIGNRVPRPEFAKRPDIIQLADKTTPPEWLVHAHWAVLGFTFIEKDYFPGFKGDCVFCSHGSWNSTKPIGAVVQRVLFDQVTGKPYGSLTLVDCQGPDRRLSRPVDAAEVAGWHDSLLLR